MGLQPVKAASSLVSEFKAFALKGNVVDLAVGVIIGAAFGKIVDSLVGDVIMPLVSALIGGRLDFSSFLIPLGTVPEGTAMTTRIITGTTVHTTSMSVLCVVLEGTGLARRLKRTITTISSASTNSVTPMMM